MKYRVTVRKADGTEEKRTMEADSRFAVYEQIEKEGAMVSALAEDTGGRGLSGLMNIQLGTGVKMEERISLTKNLSAMLGAGLTLSRALSVIERQSNNKALKQILTNLETGVKEGKSFHETLLAYPKIFSPLFIAMTKAGEESGTLSDSLTVIARQMERSDTLTRKIKGAMIYPSIILVAIVVIAILMLIYVVPTLSATFAELHTKLPLATRIILAISNFVVANVVVVLAGIVALIGGFMVFVRSKIGGATVLLLTLFIPVIGTLARETYSARASRTLASLLSSGVEMLTAIAITAEVVGKNRFGAVVEEAGTRVRKGEVLSAAFADHPKLYPIFMVEMITVGEETGKVAEMLGQVAEYYETDVENQTKDLSTIIEPLLMLFIGAFVGVFALAMIAPIYSLSSSF